MGDPVEVAVVTDGRRSASAGTTEEERIDARRREATRAMSILGIDELSWLSHEEWSWDLDRVVDDLRKIVGQRPPSVIYAPCRIDGHPEHVRVAHAVARAVNDGSEIMIRGFQIHTPLTPLLVNRAFDVSSVAETAARALAAYETQLASIARTRRLKRYSARLHGAESEAEVFWEMTSTDYRRAHAIVDEQEWRAYTGLGPNAFRDPAAYLIGLRARLKTRAGSSLR
jgi:LmbE family N-acetylglucosaminyl deacetylase